MACKFKVKVIFKQLVKHACCVMIKSLFRFSSTKLPWITDTRLESYLSCIQFPGDAQNPAHTQRRFIDQTPSDVIVLDQYFSPWTMKTEGRHDVNFVVTGGNGGYLNDNLRCRQWRQNCHHDNYWFSIGILSMKPDVFFHGIGLSLCVCGTGTYTIHVCWQAQMVRSR